MITNFWNNIELYCGNHEEPILMEAKEGPLSLFYSCPKYYEANREKNEKPCFNRISTTEYEAIIKHLSNMVEKAELNNETIDLNHYTWSYRGISMNIFSATKDKVKIAVINKRVIKKK